MPRGSPLVAFFVVALALKKIALQIRFFSVLLIAFATKPEEMIGSATFQFVRAAIYAMINVYMVKMAGVFMITTSTIALYTGIAPRWLAVLGYALALLLLFGSYYISWSFAVFPIWVFLLSVCILADNFRRKLQRGGYSP